MKSATARRTSSGSDNSNHIEELEAATKTKIKKEIPPAKLRDDWREVMGLDDDPY